MSMKPNIKRTFIASVAAHFFLALALIQFPAAAAGFTVSPIMLDLNSAVKSGVIEVGNEGNEKINVQIKALEWTEDKDGQDVYSETADLIYFPRMMSIEKDERRVIRLGLKAPVAGKEKTYRVFIEELPRPKTEKSGGIGVLFRFGAPIFVKPVKEILKGEIVEHALLKGKIKAVIKNSGNVHFKIASVIFKGKSETGNHDYVKELNGWYLLNGASRSYEAVVPREVCSSLSSIEIEVKADKIHLHDHIDVSNKMCQP